MKNHMDNEGYEYNKHIEIVGKPKIGKGTWIGAFCVLDATNKLTIGKLCGISRGVQIYTHSTAKNTFHEWKGKFKKSNIESKPTIIEDYVYIGANAVILMGCKIGHHSLIGAGAVVLEETYIPPYSTVVGVPAKVVRTNEPK